MARKRSPEPDMIEREAKVLELRLAGLTWRTIAEAVGYSSGGAAWKAYQRAIQRVLREPADEVRQQELERLDRMMTIHYQRATQGDVAALNAVVKVMHQRALLLGLYAPTRIDAKTEVSYSGGGDIDAEVARLAQLLAEGSGGEIPVD